MRNLFKLAALLSLLVLGAPAQAQVSFGFSFGQPPPAPRVYRVPPQPGPGYVWVNGYWYPNGGRYAWHDGYWANPHPVMDASSMIGSGIVGVSAKKSDMRNGANVVGS